MMLAEAPVIMGRTMPRLFTPPLITGAPGPCGCGCALTPETSYGFDVEDFARDVLGQPLDPWQRWLVIHAGEMLPDGRPRFRQVLTLVARQNGKTELLKILALFWLWVEGVGLVLGTSTNLDTARESWEKAVTTAETNEFLSARMDGKPRRANGEQTLYVQGGGRYRIAASNRAGGRGFTIDRLIMDELREHQSFEAHAAATHALRARRYAQIWMISNQGDEKSVVLNQLREQALKGTGERLGLFEWSSPDPMAADDPEALAMANPSLGGRIDLDSLLEDARAAIAAGGELLASFLTEAHCRKVDSLNPAVDMVAWGECFGENSLANLRDRVALCLDVSLDELHASLYAAAVDGERVRVDVIDSWEGASALREMELELPDWLGKVKPRVLGWFPNGPAAASAAALVERPGFPPDGVDLQPIREVTAVCMGFAEQVRSHTIVHGKDQMLEMHLLSAEKLHQGDGWRFGRRKSGYVDAAYAAAGAVHLARTLPPQHKVSVWFA